MQVELGHFDPAMTLRVYAHLWPDEPDHGHAAVDGVLAEALGPPVDHGAEPAGATPHRS